MNITYMSPEESKLCLLEGCNNPVIPHGGFGPYCSKKCTNRAYYLKNREDISEYNSIQSILKKQDKILRIVWEQRKSLSTPIELLRFLGFKDGEYSKQVFHPTTNEVVHFFKDFGITFINDKNCKIYERAELFNS